MANTYELIASATVGAGGASSIDFTSIPSTYTDINVLASVRASNTTSGVQISFNGVTTNRSMRLLYGSGSAAASAASGDMPFDMTTSSQTTNTFASASIYIPNYASSNYKSVSIESVQENNATAAYAEMEAGLWSSTAAINQVTLTGSFAQYSTAYLYGIKNS